MRELSKEQQVKIVSYWKSIIDNNLSNRTDLDNNKLIEYWQRHSGDYSSKKNKMMPWSGSSDIHIPVSSWACRATEARFSSGINNLDKYVSIIATNSDDLDAAQQTQEYVNFMFKEKLNVDPLLSESAQNDIVEGVTINKLVPREIKKKEKKFKRALNAIGKMSYAVKNIIDNVTGQPIKSELEMEQTEKEELKFLLTPLHLSDFLIPLNSTNIQDAPWVAQRLHLNKYELKKRAKENNWINVGKYDTKTVSTGGYNDVVKQDKAEREGTNPAEDIINEYKPYEIWGYYPIDNIDKEEKNIDMSVEDKLCLFVIDIEKNILLYADVTPFPEEFKPFTYAPFYAISGRFIGQSLPARLALLNDQLDSFFNMMNDNGKLANTVTFLAKDQKGIDWDKVIFTPGKTVVLPQIDEGFFRELRLTNHTLDYKNTIQYIHTLLERMSLITDTTMGMESAGVERPTYRGKVINLQETAINYSGIIKNFQNMVRELVVMLLDYLYWYLPGTDTTYQIPDEKGELQTKTFKREYLENRKSFKIIPLGNAVSVIAQQEKANASMLYEVFSQDNSGEVDKYALKENLIDNIDPKLKGKILRTPQEMQILTKAMAMIQQKQMELAQREQGIAAREKGVDLTGEDPLKTALRMGIENQPAQPPTPPMPPMQE